MTLATWVPGTVLVTDMAVGLGYFKQVEKACHTTVAVDTYTSATPMVAGLQAGQVNFVNLAGPTQDTLYTQGQVLTNLTNFSQGGIAVIVSSNQVTPAPPKNPAGLDALKAFPANTTWGVTSLQGTTILYIDELLTSFGYDPKQATLIPLGVSGIPPAVSAGKVTLGYLPASPAGTLVVGGQANEVLNTSGPAAYKATGFVSGWSLLATPAFVKQYPKLSQLMTEAELKGLFYLQDNFTNAQAVYDKEPASFQAANPEPGFAASWGWAVSGYTATGSITKQSLVTLGAQLNKYNVNPTQFNAAGFPSDVVNTPITKAAFKAIGKPYPTKLIDLKLLATSPN